MKCSRKWKKDLDIISEINNMIKIITEEFEIIQLKNSNLYDLKLPTIVNSGKVTERKEMKVYYNGVHFEVAVKTIISKNLSDRDITTSLSGYVKLYTEEVDRVCNLITPENIFLVTKENIKEDGS